MALASIIGIVAGDAAAAPVFGLLITVAFSFVFAYLQPLKKEDTILGIVLSYSLVLLFVAALMIKVDATSDDEDDQKLFGALLIVILFAGPAVPILSFFEDFSPFSSKETDDATKEERLTAKNMRQAKGANGVSIGSVDDDGSEVEEERRVTTTFPDDMIELVERRSDASTIVSANPMLGRQSTMRHAAPRPNERPRFSILPSTNMGAMNITGKGNGMPMESGESTPWI